MKDHRFACLVSSLGAVLALAGGCADRVHLTAGYGRSVSTVLAAQKVNADAGRKPRTQTGFDAQEASIVARNYRQSLMSRPAASDDSGILMLAPSKAAAREPFLPLPSVPAPERK